jgi:oligopeptide/dipeptide ABC transporter ATP-binding protein
MALLEVENLRVRFRTRHGILQAVDGVSFSVDAGEVVGIVGESGSGKSVTALSLLRLLPKTARIVGGSVRFDGQDLLAISERSMRQVRGNKLAMIFQDPMTSLNPTSPIGKQIAESYYLHRGGSWATALARAAELLDAVGVPDATARLRDYPHQFSGGMRQRAMIAMSLACSPKLLIADEPTTALDVTIQAQILQLLGDLQRKFGMAVLLITHDMGVVAETSDRVLVMYGGQVVEQGATAPLFAQPLHHYTNALLGCVPRIDGVGTERGSLISIQGSPPDLAHLPPGCRFAPRCPQAREQCSLQLPTLEPAVPRREVACHYPLTPGVPGGAGSYLAAGLQA